MLLADHRPEVAGLVKRASDANELTRGSYGHQGAAGKLRRRVRDAYSMPDQVAASQAPVAFLSHASEDKATFVEPLGRALAALGVQPWLDKWEIRPGDSLVQKLFDEGLSRVDVVVIVISAVSATKPWVREELDSATVRRITEGTRLIPVRLDGTQMPAPLQHLAWIDAERSTEGVAQTACKIADIMHGHDPRPAVAPPPVYASTVAIPGLTR